MNFSYILEQFTSFTIEDVILKICYFLISIIVSKVLQRCWKKVKIYINERKTISELSESDKEFIKNNNFELEVDKKDRIWGVLAYQEDFQRIARPAYNNMQNQNWPAIIYRLKLSGTFVYLPENNMLGFIHPSERYAEPRLGQVLDARVIGFREVDRTLNLSLKPRSFEMLENDAQMILAYLEGNGGFMTLNDKSSPEEIKATFGISKGQFKKALGGLMKAKKIKQDQFGTELI